MYGGGAESAHLNTCGLLTQIGRRQCHSNTVYVHSTVNCWSFTFTIFFQKIYHIRYFLNTLRHYSLTLIKCKVVYLTFVLLGLIPSWSLFQRPVEAYIESLWAMPSKAPPHHVSIPRTSSVSIGFFQNTKHKFGLLLSIDQWSPALTIYC